MKNKGKFVISLDFELQWGMIDHVGKNSPYRQNIKAVHEVVPQLIALFDKYEIHATFATVGLLFFENVAEIRNFMRDKLLKINNLYGGGEIVSYDNKKLNTYSYLNEFENDEPEYFFAPRMVEQIKKYPNLELGSHTFSHYYCLESGQTAEQFREDLAHTQRLAAQHGVSFTSLVFPRNQINDEYLPICAEMGFLSVRSNESSWMYRAAGNRGNTLIKRMFRLLDAYFNLSGHHCYALHDLSQMPLLQLPASRFLRPYSGKLHMLELLKLRRIKKSMTYAARSGKIFHLWWHPHNFGCNTAENLAFCNKIMEHYRQLHQKYGFESCTMQEIVKSLNS
jgi:hypothetical protein